MSFTSRTSQFTPPATERVRQARNITIYYPGDQSGWLEGVIVDVQGDVTQLRLFTHHDESERTTSRTRANFKQLYDFFSAQNGTLGMIPTRDPLSITLNCGRGSSIEQALEHANIPQDMHQAIMKEVKASWRAGQGHHVARVRDEAGQAIPSKGGRAAGR